VNKPLATLAICAALCTPAPADDQVLINCQIKHAGESDATTVAEYCIKVSRLADKRQAARTLGYTDARCFDAGGMPPPPGHLSRQGGSRWLHGWCTYRNPQTGDTIAVYGE
jgi:hypothetical protein